jgi:hypothetical protein
MISSDLAIIMKFQKKNPCIFLATYCNLVYNLVFFKIIFQKLEIWQVKSPEFVFAILILNFHLVKIC